LRYQRLSKLQWGWHPPREGGILRRDAGILRA
jgi:hypothetical protein